MKATKDLVDDALHATRAAAKEGYVPGGGVALLRTQDAILAAQKKAKGDEKLGFDIVAARRRELLPQIAENAGFDGDVVVEKVKDGSKGNFGFNAATGEYGDLVKMGIIDPALVAKTALINAASVAGLRCSRPTSLITELKEPQTCSNRCMRIVSRSSSMNEDSGSEGNLKFRWSTRGGLPMGSIGWTCWWRSRLCWNSRRSKRHRRSTRRSS
jgi:hypothetical protein